MTSHARTASCRMPKFKSQHPRTKSPGFSHAAAAAHIHCSSVCLVFSRRQPPIVLMRPWTWEEGGPFVGLSQEHCYDADSSIRHAHLCRHQISPTTTANGPRRQTCLLYSSYRSCSAVRMTSGPIVKWRLYYFHGSNTSVFQEALENVLTATIVLTSTLVVLEVTSVTYTTIKIYWLIDIYITHPQTRNGHKPPPRDRSPPENRYLGQKPPRCNLHPDKSPHARKKIISPAPYPCM